jgi:hypothetical protein
LDHTATIRRECTPASRLRHLEVEVANSKQEINQCTISSVPDEYLRLLKCQNDTYLYRRKIKDFSSNGGGLLFDLTDYFLFVMIIAGAWYNNCLVFVDVCQVLCLIQNVNLVRNYMNTVNTGRRGEVANSETNLGHFHYSK